MADLIKQVNVNSTTYDIGVKAENVEGLDTLLDNKADKSEGAFFIEGTGTTNSTAKTSTWTGTSDRITEYYDGLTIRYKIGVVGESTVTLNINDLGAKTVYRFSTSKLTTHFPVGSIINLIYHADLNDGCWMCNDYDANTNTQMRVYRQTSGYNADYPLLVSRTKAADIATKGSNGSYEALYGVMWDDASIVPTLNPSTGEIKAIKFTGTAALSGTPTAPTAAVGTNTTQIATTAFVKTEINSVLAASEAMIFKGTLGTGGTITALPASHDVGDTYKVITAGTYAGVACEVGDMIICITDGTATNNAHWTAVQSNIDGAVTGPTSATDGRIAIFNGTTGKVIKDSGYSPSSFATSGHKHTVSHTPAGTIANASIKPAGSVSSTFTGTAANHSHTFTGTAANHNHTFTGSAGTASATYTPAGSVSSTFTGSNHKHAFTGTAANLSLSYTPAGSVSSTFTGSSHNHTFTGSAVTSGASSANTTVYSITGVGSLPSCTYTAPSFSGSVANGRLTLSFSAGTHTFSAGSLPTRSSAISVATAAHTHSVTASGTVANTTAGGTISSTFTGTAGSATGSYTPAGAIANTKAGGTISSTFTGTQATINSSYTPSGTIANTSVKPAGTIANASITPAGSVSSTFTGTAANHSHTFTGTAATITTSGPTT